MAKTKSTPNLFATASVKKTKTAAKDDKENIVVQDKDVAQAIVDYEDAKKAEAAAKTAKAQAEAIIKPHAKELFLDMYDKSGRKPESFILSSTNHDDSLLYIVMDSYKKIDEERFEYLSETYGEDIVADESEFVMDKNLIQEYGQELSEAIMNAKNIPDHVKGQIIQKVEKYTVAKGTIDRLGEIAKKAKTSISAIFEEIFPTQQLKSRGK